MPQGEFGLHNPHPSSQTYDDEIGEHAATGQRRKFLLHPNIRLGSPAPQVVGSFNNFEYCPRISLKNRAGSEIRRKHEPHPNNNRKTRREKKVGN